MTNQCTEERFLRDVGDHEMSVIRDDGVNRHIRFKRSDTICCHFDLITWAGHLCVTGDCGTYVFQRTNDMFDFFRTDRNYDKKDGRKLYINDGYWAEKVISQSKDGGITEFSEELFRKAIKESFDNHFQHEVEEEESIRADATEDDPLHPNELAELVAAAEKRNEIWQEIEDEVLRHADGEHQAYHAAYEFEHEGFQFQDFFEHNLKEYTFRYIWNCYAIAWGIEKYDMATSSAEEIAA